MATRILGIDPGYAIVGWAIIDKLGGGKLELVDFGVINTNKDLEHSERLGEIYNDISSIINEFQPEQVNVETLLFQKNEKTAMKVSEARGVILLACRLAHLKLVEVNPMQVKAGITGYGNADKGQVQRAVQLLFNLKELPQPDDAADAIAVGVVLL